MTLLVVDNLGKFFGAVRVFGGVTFTISRGERVGLVGTNGSGKTTLLETLAGRLTPDEGRVAFPGRPKVGYLEQQPAPPDASLRRLFDYALAALSGAAGEEERLRRLEEEMAGLGPGSPALPALMDEYGALRDAYERAGGYTREARARSVLFGLGFSDEHLSLPLDRLSAGQRTRARLAGLLLEEPDLLMLDEPSNHLDLEAAEWLESFILSYGGAVLVVAHDRYLLDRTVLRVLELERGRLTGWTGNYSAYVTQKEQAVQRSQELYERREAEAERLKAYIRRYKAGNRTTMAQSREKALARLQPVDRLPARRRSARLAFRSATPSGREVLRLIGVGVSFAASAPDETEARWLFRDVTVSARRGQRIALLGRNGAGKTTLLRVVVGRRPPTEGNVVWGHQVRTAYFSQGMDELEEHRSVLETIMTATGYDIPTSRDYLGRFLYSGEEVMKPVAVLSGGERSRLVLAVLIASGPNVLVLDEPTNHLDLQSREALERSLGEFPGTVIFVSHDRYFVDRLATRIWELDGGTLTEFAGTYAEYRLSLAGRQPERSSSGGTSATGRPPSPPATERSGPVQAMSKGRRDRLRRDLDALERQITDLERRRDEIGARLADPESYRQGTGAGLSAEYRDILARLEETLTRWEELARALED